MLSLQGNETDWLNGDVMTNQFFLSCRDTFALALEKPALDKIKGIILSKIKLYRFVACWQEL